MEQPTFRTLVPISPSKVSIKQEDGIVLIGSCFSENIAAKLIAHKFLVTKNPYGILYHPLAIRNALMEIMSNKTYQKEDLFYHNELWQSWNHHSDFSGLNEADVLNGVNASIKTAHNNLKTAKHLIITFGTSWGYRLKSTGSLVANCHKFSNKEFEKSLIPVDEIITGYTQLIKQLLEFNPSINIHFTISPVRHLRDGFRENQWSKSTLQLAVQQLEQVYNQLLYFPAYELIVDDLRDYRFYKEDMVHPNNVAIDYVWDTFSEVYFNTATKTLNKQITKLVASSLHRAFQPTSEAHQQFIKNTLLTIQELTKKYPYLDFKKEVELLENQIT